MWSEKSSNTWKIIIIQNNTHTVWKIKFMDIVTPAMQTLELIPRDFLPSPLQDSFPALLPSSIVAAMMYVRSLCRSLRNYWLPCRKNSLELLNIQLASLAGDCRVGCGITRCRIQLAAVQSRFRCPRLIARQWLAAEFTKPGIAQLSA